MTVDEKISILTQLYPELSNAILPANSPVDALCKLWANTACKADAVDLTVVAGSGDAGVTGKDAGGSVDEYRDVLRRLNRSLFATGEPRMDFREVSFVEQPRGDVSGSVLRELALSDMSFIDWATECLGPRFRTRPFLARQMRELIRERSKAK